MSSELRRDQRRRLAAERERGAAAVELAIVLFPLLLLVLGIAEFGRLYSQQLQMQHAAREAARHIALAYDDPGMTLLALDAEARDIVDDLVPQVAIADLTVNTTLCDPAVVTAQDAVVTVDDELDLAMPLPDAGWNTVPVTARAEMPCEG